MKNSGPLVWILLGALAIVSAGLAYVLLRSPSSQTYPTAAVAPGPGPQGLAQAQQPAPPPARFTRAAVTADPNGFSNVRGGPSVEHPIVGRVEQGETFTTYPQTGQFWEVRMADNTVGYMASEFIRMMSDGGARVPVAGAPPPTAQVVQVPVTTVQPARMRRSGGMIFPDSDRRLLGPGDIVGLSGNELRVARNEIYARRGRAFADANLRRYFEQFAWYRPVAAEVALNNVESRNVAFLQSAETGR